MRNLARWFSRTCKSYPYGANKVRDVREKPCYVRRFAESGRKGWDKLSPKKRKDRIARQTGYWQNMSEAERKAEMKRRTKVRAANKLKNSGAETTL